MEIHTYEKIWIAASLVLIVGFISTVVYGAAGLGIKMIDDSGGTVDSDALSEHPQFGDPGVTKTGEDTYEVYVIARKFAFQPGTGQPIEVPANSRVTFHVASADVIHGFDVVGTNLNTMVIPGQVSTMTTEFEETGEYGIVCNEYCGSGHHFMEGKLVVVPESEFDTGEVSK